MNTYTDINTAYTEALLSIRETGQLISSVRDKSSIGSHFGIKERDFMELRGYGFALENPRDRIIVSKARNASLGFAIANFLWVLGGKSDVESISFYNKQGKAFAEKESYYEAAFGDRLFGTIKQWEYAKKLLVEDPYTRRAFMPLFNPSDLKNRPKDTPCAASIHLMQRNNKLDFFLHMRSQSVAMVFPYDIFLFTMLHEFFSISLGLPLGIFYYYCNSFHYYIEEETLVNKILEESNHKNIKGVSSIMQEMPTIEDEQLSLLLAEEANFRKSTISSSFTGLENMEKISSYWTELLTIAMMKGAKENGITQDYGPNKFSIVSDFIL